MSILVSGAGIGGPHFAYWATKAGFDVTVIEKAPKLRKSGQNVDIRDAALEIIKRTGTYEQILASSTGEEGLYVVDANNRVWGSWLVDKSGKNASPTSENEILRGTLADVLYQATKERVEYIFGDHITAVTDLDDGVQVGFASGKPERKFDLLVCADGMYSSTRKLIFPELGKTCLKSLGVVMAYFAVPLQKTDDMFARVWTTTAGRCLFIRPDKLGVMRSFLITRKTAIFDDIYKVSPEKQKQMFYEAWQGAGYETQRIIDGMMKDDDFYVQDVIQVKTETWSRGHSTLLGDAGYCPSVFTGMGTSLAILAGYVLAGELMVAKKGDKVDVAQALEGYQAKLRPYVLEVQQLPPGFPLLALPQSRLGALAVRVVFAIASLLTPLLVYLQGGGIELEYKLPAYEWPDAADK
ncbi:uncharacterized protein L969DRAFT_16921 [Mixia osmundae IAM 14324]|uniref:FAD-binding domain-containing protein n=1 Tax=Mixia osmundae (strain CBS 9802 / IAM 14324 / JCM 22182 / KY 12970) TaxID=764103 RepID=G7E902_MIXOS|nr:uncharacterized protein L969DRAFT_16921 [Mixia osmundae IAM 14324]KEI40256.1 hypothetical protein L969DRAFT_16921 [Mixia osmundae IAM 14324]GAA99620.1 hypothetical protein E5Q_06321 [Mixia osmundae IAM 14324]